jgi:hypothetical protein
VSLFAGTGPSATLLDLNDDGTCPPGNFDPVTGGCLDATLLRNGVLPGAYTLALSVSFNIPNGPSFGDGFSGGGDFMDVLGDTRTNNFAVDIVTTPVQPIPEPATILLFSIGILILGYNWHRRKQM